MSEAAYDLALTMRVMAGGDRPVPFNVGADARVKADLRALLADAEPRFHVWQRARGYMKTTSSAVAATAALLVDAPANSVIQVYAADGDQARIVMQGIKTILSHLPPSAPSVTVTRNSVTRDDNDAMIRIETSDAASALGAMNLHTLILDEFANWPDVEGHRALWDNVFSGAPKTGATRVLIVTSAGPIGTFAYERLMTFQRSKFWRYSLAPGPAPWRTQDDLDAQREGLSSLAAFKMFHLNEFSSAENALTSEDDLQAAVAESVRERPYQPGTTYVVTADLGTAKDASVITVMHRDGSQVIQDVLRRYLPRLGRRVDLAAVRDEIETLHRAYGMAPVIADASQAFLMTQELQERGVNITAIPITLQYNNACASALATSFEQRRISILDIKEQTDELRSVILRTRTSGGTVTVSLDSSGSGHDDTADVLAMGAQHLLAQPWYGAPVQSNSEALQQALVRRPLPQMPGIAGPRRGPRRGPESPLDRAARRIHGLR